MISRETRICFAMLKRHR